MSEPKPEPAKKTPPEPVSRPSYRLDHLIGLLLAVGYVGVLLATSSSIAMTRDEGFYVTAAESYARWFEVAFEDFEEARDPEVIHRYWENNREHPGLAKSLFALSWLAHQKWDLFENDSAAFRFPGMVFGGLLLWLIYIFGTRVHDRQVGLFAALAFALIPRVFYHSHLNCFDIPTVFMNTWVVYCYYRSLSDRRWLLMVGLSFGLALATKHNSWIVPGILLIHWVWCVIASRVQKAPPGTRMSPIPWWLLAMLVLGPPLLIATWPWVWNDTLERLAWYAGFHTNHEHYHVAYFGEILINPPFPVMLPTVLILYTLPATLLLLFVWGLVLRGPALLPAFLAKRLGTWIKERQRKITEWDHVDVLWFGCLVAPIVVISLPDTPVFGGTKHWMPGYPFLALFAGIGFRNVLSRAGRVPAFAKLPKLALGALMGTALLIPSAVETVHSHGYGLSHYTYFAGGVPGAADKGMSRQFWGFTQAPLMPWLAEEMPDGGTIFPSDATSTAWRMMHRDGMLPPNIRDTWSLPNSDYFMVHHQLHFAEEDGQAWLLYGDVAPVRVLTYDGVPIVSVYKNPNR